ncbi:MAG TPA: diguanylate cyclase [Thermoanaerobaculaceae bacterium]|nr:diguanylate cyclase [Thermoanaerobaculaceae bacterium]
MVEHELEFFKALIDNLHDGVYFVDRERRITYWNRGAERISGYSSAEVVGSFCHDNILRHVDACGTQLCMVACPLAFTIADGRTRDTEVYLHHRDGHRVPVRVRVAPVTDAAGAITGAVEVFSENAETMAALERIEELQRIAYLDPLTRLANRRYAVIHLEAKIHELRRFDWPFGVIFVDIDEFKAINDRWGHERGDLVLKMVAKTLERSVRSFDLVGRWGGDEFIAAVTNVNEHDLSALGERFRILVEASGLESAGDVIRATVSLGLTLARPSDDPDSLVRRADGLMLASKLAGRNRTTLG